MFPKKQEILYRELSENLSDDPVTSENVRSLKYLNNILRESYRFTTMGAISTTRQLSKDITLGGYNIPAYTTIFFCTNAMQTDPKYVDDTDQFLPERWDPKAIEERKGTPKEVLDHRILAEPFGFGPRMCLGARVAKAETRALLARLIRDWRITCEPAKQNWRYSDEGTFLAPKPFPTLHFEARK